MATFKLLSKSKYAKIGYPYAVIRITMNRTNYDMEVMFSKEGTKLNASKLMITLQEVFKTGSKKALSNFLLTIDATRFIDKLSFNKFGHLCYTYDGGKCIYDTPEFNVENIDEYMLKKDFLNSGKFSKNKDKLEKSNMSDMFGEDLARCENSLRGKFMEYEITEKIVEYVLPEHTEIAKPLTEFIGQVLANEVEVVNEEEEVDVHEELKRMVETELNAFKERLFRLIDNM